MNWRGFVVLVITLTAGLGCGRRTAPTRMPNMVIPVACASEITLMHCDARVSPPKCGGARVRYRNGCERIVMGERQKP